MESLGVSDKRAFLSAVPTTPLKQNSRKRKLDFDDDPVVVASGRAFCNNAHNNNNKYSGNSDSGGSPFIFHPDLQPHRPLNNNYNSQFTEIPSSAAKAVPFRFPFSLINDPNTVHCLRHSFQQRPALQQNWCASACGHLHSNVMLPYLPPYPNVVNSAVTYQFSPLHGYPYSISFPNISRGNTGNGNGLQSSNFHSPNASMGHAWGGSQTYLAPYTPEKSVQNKRLLKDKSWFSGSIYSPGGPDQKQHEARHNILDNSGLQVDKYQAEALALGLGSSATTQTNVQQKHVLSFQSATIFSGIEEIDLEANASNYFVNANVDSLHLHEKERPSAASASDTAEVDQNKIVAEKDAREDEGTAKNVDGARVFVGQIQILDFDSSQTIAHQLQTRADGNELCDADVGKGPEELDLNKLPQQRPKRKKHRPKVQAEGASKKKPRAKNAHKVEAKTTTEQEGEKAEFCSEGEKQQTDGNYHTNKITEELIETVPVTQEQVTVTPEQNAVSTEGTVRRKKQQVKENVKDLARKIHCSRLQDSSQGIPQSGDVKTLSHSRRDENPRRRTKANGKKGTKTSHPAIFLESNFQDSHRGINPSRTERTYYSLLEGVIRRMKELQIGQENNGRDDSSRLQLTLSERNHELVPYIATRDIVAYEGPLRKRKPRARVDLDNETNRVWRLLMGKASNDDKHPTDEEEKERQWEEEREVFRGRVEAFISRMHLVQGDRSFSKWKGSVVDSVVGAFLTQNVADHLSSSAFMALASRFPPYDRKSEVNAQINIKDSETGGLDLNKCVEEATELSQNMENGTCLFPGQEFEKIKEASYSTEISQDSENESHLLVAQNADSFKDTSNYSESYASNVSSAQGTSVAMTSNCNPSEFKCRSTILDAEQFVSCDVGNNYGYEVQTLQQILQSDYNTREDQIYESDAHTFGQEIPGSEYSTDNNHTEANAQTYYNSFGELLRRVMKKAGKKVEEVDFGLSHSEIYASNFFNVTSEKEDSHSPVVESFHGQANATADPSVVQTATESRHKLPDANKALQVDLEDPSCSVPELVEDPGVQTATEAINRLPGVNKALAVDLEDRSCSVPEVIEENKSVLKENSNPSKTSSQSTIVDTIPQQNEGFCSTEEFHMFNNSDLILERMPISSSQKTENLEISSASVDKERLNLSNKSSQPSFLSPSTGYSPGTEQSECAATFCSIPQEENAFTAVVNGSTPETVPCMVQTDCQTSPDKEMHRLSIRHVENDALHLDNSNLAETPKNELNNGTSQTGRTPNRNISGIDRANIEMKQGGNKKISNWEAISERVAGYRYAYCGAKKERHANARDATDWDAVRCAEVEEIAETIKDRGMNNVLAGRIKAFLERLHSEQGCIDLEWLKDVPSDDAKDFLLSIRGLGLKSVECIRLLALQHLAFPVDTNVGRICVRLGWVPLQPLPESLQLHLLELYPVLESIQKYLWPRLCTLDQRTLYELHYQMITFGKVFCTKSRPNCNACPMRCDCKHFASAFASARLALPAPTEQSVSESGERLLQSAPENRDALEILSNLPTQYKNNDTSISNSTFPVHQLDAKPQEYCCEPIIEEPMTPEPEDTEVPESTIDDENTLDPDGIPVINLNYEQLSLNVQKIYESKSQELNDPSSETISQALVIVSPDAASIPEPKLKNVGRLRTEHRVYELPDSHPLLSRFEPREADDPSPYLLAIWGPGETPDFIGAPDQSANSMNSDRSHLEKDSCSSCTAEKYASENTVRGTMLIPCKTAMRGSFPLNGTYFQVNEVFADHLTSLNPMEVPRSWIWNLARRTVYFGTSIPTIFRGLTTEEIQYCFWRGFVCVRGFDTQVRAPRPLVARLHFPASKMVKPHKRTVENVKSKSSKQIQSGH